MIPIKSREDLKCVDNTLMQKALEKEFERLPDDYLYPEYGYFIIIESIDELTDPLELKLLEDYSSQSIFEGLEMIEQFEGYSQVVILLSSDFGVVLFVRDEIATYEVLLEVLE